MTKFQSSLAFFSHLYILTIFLAIFVSCRCPEHQKSALLNIFSNRSALPSWRDDASDDDDCCQWEGITCDDVSAHVIGLDVTNRSISASLNSSALSSLRSLRFLNLSYNNFHDSIIPSNLDSLSNLTHLNLSHSGFTGQIPAAIARMSRLVVLDLSDYYLKLEGLSAEALLRNLSRLTKLHLDGVNNSSAVPQFLSNFTRLTSLIVRDCNLVGEFPATIFRMPNLETLDMSWNQLSGTASNPPQLKTWGLVRRRKDGRHPTAPKKWTAPNWCGPNTFTDFPRENAIRILQLSGTGFSGSLPDSFRNLSHLTQLHLSDCEFSGQIPPSLLNLTRLAVLDLSYNNFSGWIPPLDSSKSIQVLDLGGNSLYGTIPFYLFTLPSLKELYLNDNRLEGELPEFSNASSTLEVIYLSENKLHGRIPISIFGFRRLQRLSLYYNRLNGSVDFAMLPRDLEVLDLGSNSLYGTIPFYLFTLPSLKELYLNDNRLEGELPEFSNASSTLEMIYLSHNKLHDRIPISIFGFRRLRQLDLSFNGFNGYLDFAMLPRIHSLVPLDLSQNSLVVNANYVGTSPFPRMRYLDLTSCNLKQFPHFLRRQLEMVRLYLSDNEIAGEIPSWLWTVGGGNLRDLNLSGNSLTSFQQPYNLSSNSFLEVLDLHSNQLQGELPLPPSSILVLDCSKNNFTTIIPSELASRLVSARFFSISGNKISGEIPPSICNASYLEVLDLSDNSLSGSIPNCFSNLLEVDVLNLKNNRLTGIIPNNSSDQRCPLRTLNLNGNQLQGKLPEALSNCRYLEVLDVGNNRLSGPLPYSHLDILSNLRVLVLRSNNFSGSLSKLCNASAPELRIIDVASNSFSGTLPADCFSGFNALMSGEADGDSGGLPPQFIKYNVIGGGYYQATVTVTSKGSEMELMKITTIFKSLDLSNNKLEGEIPKEIGTLKLLRVLNMSHNNLEGQIPASIGNSRQLESIDLSRNQLSGRIPLELNNLTFLAVLNLSYNQLVGSIPTGPQFPTFNNDSFIGNPELCGHQLSRKCENSSEKQGVGGSCSGSSPVNWLLISAQVGFTVGLGIVFGPLLFCRKWRMWYFKQVDIMLEYLTELWYYYF
ncbi:hypothetical protein ACLOJK_029415 [Asimina triloba]